MNSQEMFFNGFLHMVTPMLADQKRLIYNCSVQTLDATKKTCKEQGMIRMDGERMSGQLDNDDDISGNTILLILLGPIVLI